MLPLPSCLPPAHPHSVGQCHTKASFPLSSDSANQDAWVWPWVSYYWVSQFAPLERGVTKSVCLIRLLWVWLGSNVQSNVQTLWPEEWAQEGTLLLPRLSLQWTRTHLNLSREGKSHNGSHEKEIFCRAAHLPTAMANFVLLCKEQLIFLLSWNKMGVWLYFWETKGSLRVPLSALKGEFECLLLDELEKQCIYHQNKIYPAKNIGGQLQSGFLMTCEIHVRGSRFSGNAANSH